MYLFKNIRFDIILDMFLQVDFKILLSFANVAKSTATASTGKFVYHEFQIIRNRVFI